MYQHFKWIDGFFFFQTKSLKIGLWNSPFNVCNTHWLSGIASTVLNDNHCLLTAYFIYYFSQIQTINSFIIVLTSPLFGTFINHISQLRKLRLHKIDNLSKVTQLISGPIIHQTHEIGLQSLRFWCLCYIVF